LIIGENFFWRIGSWVETIIFVTYFRENFCENFEEKIPQLLTKIDFKGTVSPDLIGMKAVWLGRP
jgi:hypothetical protein